MKYTENYSYKQPECNPTQDFAENWGQLDSDLKALADAQALTEAGLATHIEDKQNPHETTAAQVGAYSAAETEERLDAKVTRGGELAGNMVLITNEEGEAITALVLADELEALAGVNGNIQEQLNNISFYNYLPGLPIVTLQTGGDAFPGREDIDQAVIPLLEAAYPGPAYRDAVIQNVQTQNLTQRKAVLYCYFDGTQNDGHIGWRYVTDIDTVINRANGEVYGVVKDSEDISWLAGQGTVHHAETAGLAEAANRLVSHKLGDDGYANDLNLLRDLGMDTFYYAAGGNTVANKPDGVDAFGLLVQRVAGSLTLQVLYSSNLAIGLWYRQGGNSGWNEWTQLAAKYLLNSGTKDAPMLDGTAKAAEEAGLAHRLGNTVVAYTSDEESARWYLAAEIDYMSVDTTAHRSYNYNLLVSVPDTRANFGTGILSIRIRTNEDSNIHKSLSMAKWELEPQFSHCSFKLVCENDVARLYVRIEQAYAGISLSLLNCFARTNYQSTIAAKCIKFNEMPTNFVDEPAGYDFEIPIQPAGYVTKEYVDAAIQAAMIKKGGQLAYAYFPAVASEAPYHKLMDIVMTDTESRNFDVTFEFSAIGIMASQPINRVQSLCRLFFHQTFGVYDSGVFQISAGANINEIDGIELFAIRYDTSPVTMSVWARCTVNHATVKARVLTEGNSSYQSSWSNFTCYTPRQAEAVAELPEGTIMYPVYAG